MSGDRKIYFNGIEEPDCEIIPYTQFGSDMIFMNINVPLGSCDSFVTQEMVGNKSIITFGGAVRYESAPLHSFVSLVFDFLPIVSVPKPFTFNPQQIIKAKIKITKL